MIGGVVVSCGSQCEICQTESNLVAAGALDVSDNLLQEPGCDIRVLLPSSATCAAFLKLDIAGAALRRQPNSSGDRRICDFLVAVAADSKAQYVAIELKSREPYLEDAKEQLTEGLRTVIAYQAGGPLRVQLRALLVAGVITSRLRRMALAKDNRIELDGRFVQVEIADCGGEFTV